jgi:release factor glutamine methyltransferase
VVAARVNARLNGARVSARRGDLYAPVMGERFDLIVSNPPYVAAGDPHLDALRHEPEHALVAGDDGMEAIRAIAGEAPRHLRSMGWLLLEHGAAQGEAVRQALADADFASATTIGDLGELPRVTGGRIGGRD